MVIRNNINNFKEFHEGEGGVGGFDLSIDSDGIVEAAGKYQEAANQFDTNLNGEGSGIKGYLDQAKEALQDSNNEQWVAKIENIKTGLDHVNNRLKQNVVVLNQIAEAVCTTQTNVNTTISNM